MPTEPNVEDSNTNAGEELFVDDVEVETEATPQGVDSPSLPDKESGGGDTGDMESEGSSTPDAVAYESPEEDEEDPSGQEASEPDISGIEGDEADLDDPQDGAQALVA